MRYGATHRGFESRPLRHPRRLDRPLARSPIATWLSFRSRARRGTSGALYLQSAPAGLNPLPRSPFSNAARRATLRTGSRAAANREPCQVRKEAALSDHRRVPRNGLVRAARHGGRGDVWSTEGARHFDPAPPHDPERRSMTPTRPAPGALPPLARPDVRPDRRPGGGRRDAAQRRPDRTASRTRSCSSARAARARRRWRGSSPRPSTARTCGRRRRATPARPASRSARAGRSTSSRSTPRQQPRHRRHPRAPRAPAVSARPTSGARSTSSTRPTRSQGRLERAPQVARGAARRSSSSCSPRPTRRASRRPSCRASSASTSGG